MHRRRFVRSVLATAAVSALPVSRVWGAQIAAIGRTGKPIELARADVEALAGKLRGKVILPDNSEYEQARKLWNGSFDRKPALIARCTNAEDVVQAVNFVRSTDILTAVRGGGHSISGQSGCDGGLVIDLSPMKGIRIDREAKVAHAEPGVLLGELDKATQEVGLVVTLGTVSETGIAGLTLGGGLGRLARKFGLSCDNLRAVDIATADGKLLHANARENADLFWAVRGGGGNFGVVTRFEYQLHSFGPNVFGGGMFYPFEQARTVLTALTAFAEDAPDDVYLNPTIFGGARGRAIGFELCYAGPPAEGEKLLPSLRKMGTVLDEKIKVVPYLAVQSQSDRGLPAGRGYYFKSGFLPRVTAHMVEELVDVMATAPPTLLSVPLIHLGGAVGRVKPEATAFWNRHAQHDMAIWASWENPAESAQRVADVRAFWRKLEHLTQGYYINTDAPEDAARLRNTYGGNYERLVQIKNRYDPKNLFRLNANIPPTTVSAR